MTSHVRKLILPVIHFLGIWNLASVIAIQVVFYNFEDEIVMNSEKSLVPRFSLFIQFDFILESILSWYFERTFPEIK